jgi:hypothetical protein
MPKRGHTEEQIVAVLRQVAGGSRSTCGWTTRGRSWRSSARIIIITGRIVRWRIEHRQRSRSKWRLAGSRHLHQESRLVHCRFRVAC